MRQEFPSRARAVQFPILQLALAGLLLFAMRASAQGSSITSVDPSTAKVGDLVRATGEGLGPGTVDELYLTNAAQDVKVGMVEQTEKVIAFNTRRR